MIWNLIGETKNIH